MSFFFEAFTQYIYPLTKTVDSSDTYFGVTYKDPYRWLENMKQEETITWFKRQATYTDSILNTLNGRDELISEWKQIDKQRPPIITDQMYENGRVFYSKSSPKDSSVNIYYREGMNGAEQLLFDPTVYIPGKTISVQQIIPSHDGKKIGICYTEGGAEIGTLKIIMVDTKQFLKDSIYPAAGFYAWTFDNKAFLYASVKLADNKDLNSIQDFKTKMHIVGNEVGKDTNFFSNTSYAEMNIDPGKGATFAFLEEDSKDYIFAGFGNVQRERTQYYAPIDEFDSKKISWKPLCKVSDSLRDLIYINDDVYAISHNNAPNFKVVQTSLKHPDWTNATTIVAERPDRKIESFLHTKDYLLIVYSVGINSYLLKYNFKTKTTSEVKLPYSGTIVINCINTNNNNYILQIRSWNRPFTEYNYDAASDDRTPSNFNKKPSVYPAAYNDLQVEEVEVKGHDGAMIPLTIIYKKGIRKDGSAICLLDGYGASGISSLPIFNIINNSLVAHGVVSAIAHVRGGGEKGEAWYKAGFKSTKPNTWKDFISCAEYLIAKGYTSPKKLSGIGGSAGGILISRAITERPDLFAAVICVVGIANAMRFEFAGNGPESIPEYGTVKDSVESKGLYEMDGVQHVVNGTKYPAVICVAGWNDPRVLAWQPGKFATALQNASKSGRPVLMKANYDSGHFGGYADVADQFAFILWQCGHPDFQPKK